MIEDKKRKLEESTAKGVQKTKATKTAKATPAKRQRSQDDDDASREEISERDGAKGAKLHKT